MSIKAKRYIGTIASGSGLYESMNGTLGFQVFINTEDGATDYTIWLTEKNTKRAEDGGPSRAARDFQTLGVDPSKLKRPDEFTRIGHEIAGTEISLETGEETYQGKARIKVKWISAKKDPGLGSLEERAASLFGGKQPTLTAATSSTAPAAEEDDVPF